MCHIKALFGFCLVNKTTLICKFQWCYLSPSGQICSWEGTAPRAADGWNKCHGQVHYRWPLWAGGEDVWCV